MLMRIVGVFSTVINQNFSSLMLNQPIKNTYIKISISRLEKSLDIDNIISYRVINVFSSDI